MWTGKYTLTLTFRLTDFSSALMFLYRRPLRQTRPGRYTRHVIRLLQPSVCSRYSCCFWLVVLNSKPTIVDLSALFTCYNFTSHSPYSNFISLSWKAETRACSGNILIMNLIQDIIRSPKFTHLFDPSHSSFYRCLFQGSTGPSCGQRWVSQCLGHSSETGQLY